MNNKKKSKPAAPPPSQTPPTPSSATQPPSSPPTSSDKNPPAPVSKWTKLTAFIAVLALVVSCLSYRVSDRQAALNQFAQDRASGKIRAHFAFVQMKTTDPALEKLLTKKEVGTDKDILRLDSVDDMLRWGPRVSIKNTGEEIIDALRADVTYIRGRAYGFGVKQIEPHPITLSEPSSAENASFGKLLPQQHAVIFLDSLLLDQMALAQAEFYPDKDREGVFRIEVYCRIVGVTSYDSMEPRKAMQFIFHWRPTVFADEKKCEALLNRQLRVHIVDAER